jgi:hypothetical protein
MDKWIHINKVIDYNLLNFLPIDKCSKLIEMNDVLHEKQSV